MYIYIYDDTYHIIITYTATKTFICLKFHMPLATKGRAIVKLERERAASITRKPNA